MDTTRERIIDSALEYLRHSGLEALNMDSLAQFAGVSRKTIYNHFENRQVLLDDLFAENIARIIAILETIVTDPEKDFIAQLNMVIEQGFRQVWQTRSMFSRGFPAGLDHEFLKIYRTVRRRLLSFIERIVLEATEAGLIKPEISIRKITYVLINMIEGLLYLEDPEEAPFNRLDILKESLRISFSGILSSKGQEALKASEIFLGEELDNGPKESAFHTEKSS